MEGFVEIHHSHVKMWCVYHLCCLAYGVAVIGAVVLRHVKVYRVHSQFGVQFARFAVQSWTVVVEYAVCHIARLLYLSQQYASTDGVHPASRYEEHIAWLHLVLCQHVAYRAVLHSLLVFLFGYSFVKTRIQCCTRLGVDDIPHLRLAEFVVSLACQFVVGVHLYAEVSFGVDKFH